MPTIRIKRGNKSSMPTTLLSGELAIALDTGEIAYGDGSNNRQYAKITSSNIIDKGSANGVASLDSSGKVPTSQLPSSIAGGMSYKGNWSAASGAYPTSPSNGDMWRVSVAGTVSSISYAVGDNIVWNDTASTWDKQDNTDSVTSVNGQTGAVSLTSDNVSEGSTNLYFTNGRADARADVRIAAARGAANGVASLDSSTKVPAAQIPDLDLGTF